MVVRAVLEAYVSQTVALHKAVILFLFMRKVGVLALIDIGNIGTQRIKDVPICMKDHFVLRHLHETFICEFSIFLDLLALFKIVAGGLPHGVTIGFIKGEAADFLRERDICAPAIGVKEVHGLDTEPSRAKFVVATQLVFGLGVLESDVSRSPREHMTPTNFKDIVVFVIRLGDF